MFNNTDIFEAARILRPNLSEIVDDTELVPQIDLQLAQLLTQTDLEEDTKADRILEILDGHPNTKNWLDAVLNNNPSIQRSYSGLPGDPSLQSAPKYICPIANDYTWYREDNSPIPLCPTHLVELVPDHPTAQP